MRSTTTLARSLATEIERDIDGRDGEDLQGWAKRTPFLPTALGITAKLAADIAQLQGTIKALEDKIAALELRPATTYKGAWNPTVRYAVGDSCTFHGSQWHAVAESCGRRPPGDPWVLSVRKGSDGKDGKCVCP